MNQFLNITDDGGVQKRILVEGSGDTPKLNNRCKIFYTGRLEDGTQFDTNVGNEKPLKFKLGTAEKVKGLDLGVQTMRKGEKAEFRLTPEYGYGKDGDEDNKVPGNANLIFEVELVKFSLVSNWRKKQRWEMGPDEKMKQAISFKAKATDLYKEKNYVQAKKEYKEAIHFLDFDTQESQVLQAIIQTNLSICCYQLQEYKESIDCATKAIEINSNQQQKVKALYRRAEAYKSIGEMEEAEKDLKEAFQFDNTNLAVIEELHKVKGKLKEARLKEKEAFSKLFPKKAEQEKEQNIDQQANSIQTEAQSQPEQSSEQQEQLQQVDIETQASQEEESEHLLQDQKVI